MAFGYMTVLNGIYPSDAKKKKCPMKMANANAMQDLYCEGPECMLWVTLFSAYSLPSRETPDGKTEYGGECGMRRDSK